MGSRAIRLLRSFVVLFMLALAIVWSAGRFSPAHTLDLGPEEWGRIQDANDWEDNGQITFRWTRAVTRFRLPAQGTPRRMVLRMDGTRPVGVDPAAVSLHLDGHEVVSFTPSPGPHLYHVVYDGMDAWRWETDVELRTQAFSLPGDSRELGVVVDRLHFLPLVGDPGPAWILVILWMGVGMCTTILGRVLGWPWIGSGLLAMFLMIGLGVLLRWFRPSALPWAVLFLVVGAVGTVVALVLSNTPSLEGEGIEPPLPQAEEAGRTPSGTTKAVESKDEGARGPLSLFSLLVALLTAALPLLVTDWWRERLFQLPGEGAWALYMLEPFYPRTGPIPRWLGPWLPLVLVVLFAMPAINRDLRHSIRFLWETGRRLTPRLRPPGRWIILGLLFVPIGYLLRSQILWGDGPHLIARIGAGYSFKEAEMLTFFIHGTLYRWTRVLWGWSVPDVYVLTSLLMGALYVTLSAALSDLLGRDRFEKTMLFGLLVTLAIIQFGFGYLENYTLVTVALLALFWQMVRCLKGQGSPVVVVALWVLACACHLQAVLVGPAVLYTVVRAWRAISEPSVRWRQIGLTILGGLLPLVILFSLFLVGGYRISSMLEGGWIQGNAGLLFVPLRSETTYTLFSLRHLANLVNEHLLVAPVVLPLFVWVLLRYRRRIPWRDPVLWMLVLGMVGLLVFASTLHPDLGAAMDWDLFAPSVLPYTLLTGWLFVRAVPSGEEKRYAATLLLVSAGAHAAMWVFMNARLL
jgi:hypothetical protein